MYVHVLLLSHTEVMSCYVTFILCELIKYNFAKRSKVTKEQDYLSKRLTAKRTVQICYKQSKFDAVYHDQGSDITIMEA